MVRRDMIRDFTRPTIRRSLVSVDLHSVTDVKPLHEPKPSLSFDIKSSNRSRPKPSKVPPRQDKSKVLRRQGLNKLPPFTPRKTKRHVIRWTALSGSALVVVGLVAFSFNQGKKTNTLQADYKGVLSTTDYKPTAPSEAEPTISEKKSYEVTEGSPKFLISERLEIQARIKEVDISGSNIELPDNIHDAGWYRNGGRPGQNKTTLLTGSVTGQSKQGVFGKISSLVPGDVLTVETGGGKLHNYVVREIKRYPKGEINYNELLKSARQDKEGLNIVALESRFDIRSQNIEDNFAVFAVKE